MIQNQKNIILIVILILTSPFFLGACDKKAAPSKAAAAKAAQEAAPQSADAKGTKAVEEVTTYDKRGKEIPLFLSL